MNRAARGAGLMLVALVGLSLAVLIARSALGRRHSWRATCSRTPWRR